MKKISLCIASMGLSLLGTTLSVSSIHADELAIPIGTQSPELNKVARPKMGVSMASVRTQYGEPNKQNPAKGKPPISSWEYPEFTVYFENDHVIHSVLKAKLHESEEIILKDTDEMPAEDFKLK